MSLTIRWGSLDRLLFEGLEDMGMNQWFEVGVDHEAVPLSVDWDWYRQSEKAGLFRIIEARNEKGDLAGYNAFFTMPHRRYRTTLHAVNDYVYLAPEYRKGWNGVALIRRSEALLRALGVVKIVYHAKLHVHLGKKSGSLGDLLTRLGYAQAETMHSKILGA